MNAEQLSHAWDKVFPKSEKVEYRKVRFKNRYGITLAADLYLSKTHSDRRFAALAFMNMPMLTYINAISPRPILLIAGDQAHSRYFSEDAYKAAVEPKELLLVEDAIHTTCMTGPKKFLSRRLPRFSVGICSSSALSRSVGIGSKKRGLAHQGAGLFKIRPKPENGLWRISGRAGRCACYRQCAANAMV